MTESERDGLLLQVVHGNAEIKTNVDRLQNHVDGLREQMAEIRDEHVIGRQKREDRTAEIKRLREDNDSFKLWRAGFVGQTTGATKAARVSWSVLLAVGALLAAVGEFVALLVHK